MTNPHEYDSRPRGVSYDTDTVPFEEGLNNPFSQASFPGRDEFGRTTIESSARPLEVERGRWIPDGRIFQDYQSRRDSFIIPSDTQAIIFDFDGTTTPLKLSEGIRQTAFKEVISARLSSHLSIQYPQTNDINRCLAPALHQPEQKMAEIIAKQLQELYEIDVTPEQIWSDWVACTSRRVAELPGGSEGCGRVKIVHGVRQIYQGARERGIPVAGCTNGEAGFVQMLGQAIGATDFFHPTATVYTNLHQIAPKPSPDPYLLVCEKLKVDPTKVVILEDSATGALAGLRAGGLVLLQPSIKRYKTLLQLHNIIQDEHPEWLEERQGRVVLFAQRQGFKQAGFAPRNSAES